MMELFLLAPMALQMEVTSVVVVVQLDRVSRVVILVPLSSYQLINILMIDYRCESVTKLILIINQAKRLRLITVPLPPPSLSNSCRSLRPP